MKKLTYRLGIDVGVASLGLAILKLETAINPDTGEPGYEIHGGAVRTWPLPEGAADRRTSRGMRRNIDREQRRLDRLSGLLHRHGIGPRRKDAGKNLLNISPIKSRAMASRQKVELVMLWRAWMHMARHRGSSALRSEVAESDGKKNKDAGPTKTAEASLKDAMEAKGFSTFGQYLRWLEKNNQPTRINLKKLEDGKDGYDFYPGRQLIKDEFEIIWETQHPFYSGLLTEELKAEVYREIFFQRAVTAPPPGKCPFVLTEERLPKACRLFETRRIYEETNGLRFSLQNGQAFDLDLELRDRIVYHLMAGENLTFAKLKKTVGLGGKDKVSLENSKARNGIAGYPFDLALGSEDALGELWLSATEDRQDQILEALATIHDDAEAADALTDLLSGDRDAALRGLEVHLPPGQGRMGLTATKKTLTELKKNVIPGRIAQDLAGLSHVMEPDGEIKPSLPYYGEVLRGHTVDPMWVSSYRRDSDKPPHTNEEESQWGRIPNPVVHMALRQIRKAVNAIIKKYGLPESIHIELSRDLNKSAEERDKVVAEIKKNTEANERIREIILEHDPKPNRLKIRKYKLWKEQGGVCIYSGVPIKLTELFTSTVQVDHILPRSKTYLDALSNQVVCTRAANALKSNRAPWQAFHDGDHPDCDWDAIMRQVEKLSPAKQKRFTENALKEFEEDSTFQARYGIDNSYIARVAHQYLVCLYGEPTKVVAVSSHIVGLLRGKWGLQNILGSKSGGKKARDDHRHHFIDALTAACTTKGMILRIQTAAGRAQENGLEDFVDRIAPPFGKDKEFFSAAREATFERVTLSRKADHSVGGQFHEDTLYGIVEGPDEKGSYVAHSRKKVASYATMVELEKPTLKTTLPGLPEIIQARDALAQIKQSIRDQMARAKEELDAEQAADKTVGKRGKAISANAIYTRAVKLHRDSGGKMTFSLYQKLTLVNLRYAQGNNRPTGGYVGGRNHRVDIYLNESGKLQWQVISMLETNKRSFVPKAAKKGHQLLWSAHKDDVLLIDDPDDPDRRIRVVVAMFSENKMGVVPDADARDSGSRKIWKDKGLSFFYKKGAQRIVQDAMGEIQYAFPALPRNGKAEPSS